MNMMFVVDRLDFGGAGRVISVLANEFYKRGNNVCIVVYFSSNVTYSLEEGIEVISMVDIKSNRNADNLLQRILRLRKAYKTNKIDVVISFMTELNVYAIIANFFCGKRKIIISERNNPYKSPRERSVRILRDLFYRFADGFVFQTEEARDFFSKKISKKSEIILNPLSDRIPNAYLGEREKRIVSVGRLNEQKNYPLAIKSVEKVLLHHPQYIYEIYGEGEMYDELNRMIKEKGLESKIFLRGQKENIYDLIKKAGVFLLSSDYEGMSNALIEAMALGIPVVSTDHPIGGAKRLIKNGVNGFLVSVGNDDEITERIEQIIADSEYNYLISREETKIRENLSKNNIVNQWNKYIIKILQGGI